MVRTGSELHRRGGLVREAGRPARGETPEIPTPLSGVTTRCVGRRGMSVTRHSRNRLVIGASTGPEPRDQTDTQTYQRFVRRVPRMSATQQLIEKNCRLAELLRLAAKKA
jgi:hypothetical protein